MNHECVNVYLYIVICKYVIFKGLDVALEEFRSCLQGRIT